MKYCLNFYKGSKSIKRYDEIIIQYIDQDLKELEVFFQKHDAQRILVQIKDNEKFFNNHEYEFFNAINKKYPNIAIIFTVGKMIPSTAMMQDITDSVTIPFFFDCRAHNWEILNYLLNYPISDVYITEELGFDIKQVAKRCHEKNVQIRVYPNVAQSSVRHSTNLKKFFIRPEDISTYEPYIDVLEFWGPVEKQDTIFHIYQNLRKWFGDLNELILDLDYSIDSRSMMPVFGEYRLDCQKKCIRTNACHLCDRIDSLSKTLAKEHIIIKTKET